MQSVLLKLADVSPWEEKTDESHGFSQSQSGE
jgi:hypothetical protein